MYVESGQVTGATLRETERRERGHKTGDKEKVEQDKTLYMCQLRGRKDKAQQLHPGQLFLFKVKKKSCPGCDSNPRHSAA